MNSRSVYLRTAEISEKEKIYRWLCLSDTTAMHMGPPDYPESPVPDRESFDRDFEDFYFLEKGRSKGAVLIISSDREEVGCLCYACFHLKPEAAELDIWMKARKYCGKGLGPQSLHLLVRHLFESLGIRYFLIRPSEKNTRAVTAYEKAGFQRVGDKVEILRDYLKPEFFSLYGAGDYGLEDTAVLVLEIPEEGKRT